jgi:hypothetical protein
MYFACVVKLQPLETAVNENILMLSFCSHAKVMNNMNFILIRLALEL